MGQIYRDKGQGKREKRKEKPIEQTEQTEHKDQEEMLKERNKITVVSKTPIVVIKIL
jgi:hypothetical protein